LTSTWVTLIVPAPPAVANPAKRCSRNIAVLPGALAGARRG
jgi:hypothetical protein